MSLCKWHPEGEWPDMSNDVLFETASQWLYPYLDNITRVTDLKKLNIKEILLFNLSYEQQGLLDSLAPERIEVPSGSKIKLTYFDDGSQPVLAVRLQECFGLEDTPMVCNDRSEEHNTYILFNS